jgi:hypothetical protein
MKNSVGAMRGVQRKNALGTMGRLHRHAKRTEICRNLPESAAKSAAIAGLFERKGCVDL